MHTQLCQILSFYGPFSGAGAGEDYWDFWKKDCDTLLCSLVLVRILPPILEGRKQISAAVKVIEQAELFWPFWKIPRDIQKFRTTIKAGCSMLTETGDRIGSKADGDISSLSFAATSPKELRWKWSSIFYSLFLQPDLTWRCALMQLCSDKVTNSRKSQKIRGSE